MKIAILYDFDKTLTYKDMQEYGFIEDLGYTDPKAFWTIVQKRAMEHKMDSILAYLYEMVDQSRVRHIPLTRTVLAKYGARVDYYPGVLEWFDLINAEAQTRGLEIEHYILSSGLTEIIEATEIARHFRKIYACEFLYDEYGQAVWPKLSVNYTVKTQYLFRINKGILDIENDADLNRYQPESERPVPFSNMIYIGDGFTDVPSMKLVKSNGGHAIGVYPFGQKSTQTTETLLKDNRVDFIAEADYRAGGRLHRILTAVFDAILTQRKLEDLHHEH